MVFQQRNSKNYQVAWSPRRYCKYAVTNKPAIVTGTNPNTIPDNKGSTIKKSLNILLIFQSKI